MNNNTPSESFKRLYDLIIKLRSPEGCPWDRKQTPDSIKENIIEEAYECFDAIMEKDEEHICEEIGDLYLLATFEALMFEEKKSFSVADSLDTICEKLIRRHPHVFADSNAGTAEEVKHQWEEIKEKVEGRINNDSVLDSVPKHFPPLLKALKLQKKAAKQNFDWEKVDDVIVKLDEEINEFKDAVANNDKNNIEEELGDILFTIVNISRFLSVDPSTALIKTNNKFIKRFKWIESTLKDRGESMKDKCLEELDKLWEQSKKIIDNS